MKWLVGLAALALAGCVTVPSAYHENEDLQSMTRLIEVSGDRLDGYRMASSDRVRMPYCLLCSVSSDIWVRAFAYDDGHANVQIYIWTKSDADWLFPYALNFGDPLRTVQVQKVNSDVDCWRSNCHHREDVVANLDEPDLRYLLSEDCPELIEVRLKGKAGDVDRTIRKTELIATLNAVGLLERFGGSLAAARPTKAPVE